MSHQDDRGTEVIADLFETVDDLLAGVGVEIAGGLVGHEDGRVVGQRAGDGDTLLLAARQLTGAMAQAIGKTETFEEEASSVGIESASFWRTGMVGRRSRGRRGWDEVEELKDEAQLLIADRSTLAR